MTQRWLRDWPWETVVVINAGLCKEKKALHKPAWKAKGKEPEAQQASQNGCCDLWIS